MHRITLNMHKMVLSQMVPHIVQNANSTVILTGSDITTNRTVIKPKL